MDLPNVFFCAVLLGLGVWGSGIKRVFLGLYKDIIGINGPIMVKQRWKTHGT